MKIKTRVLFFPLLLAGWNGLAQTNMSSVNMASNTVASNNWAPILSLAEAQRMALANHPQVAAADYRVLAAQEAVTETRSGYYPQANLYADAAGASAENARILAGGINNPSVYNRAAGGIAVSQLITDFGHTANLSASSKFQAQAENQNATATREQVLLQASTAYLGTLEAQAVLGVAQQTLTMRQLLLDQVGILATNQLKSELDVSFARVAVAEARLLVQKASNDADAAMTSLSTALGYREPRTFHLIEQSEPAAANTNDVSALVETALEERPELLSLRDQNNAALHLAKSQRDARLPVVQALALAGGAPVHDEHVPDDYAVGAIQVSVPLFAGGLYTARQREAELKAEADVEMLRSAENDIIRDVHIAWLNLNNAQEQLQTTGDLVHNAAEAYDLAEARYKAGSSSIVELSQAQLSLTSAQIDEANARYNVMIQQANLDYQTGEMR